MTGTLLRGRRVVLRPLAEDHVPAVHRILSHPEVAAWWGPYDERRIRRDYLASGAAETAFAILEGGSVVGLITYREEDDPEFRHAGIDIGVDAERLGEGLGTDALRALARHLFEDRGHHRLTIDPAAANGRAIAAYRKLGFRPVGVMRSYWRGADGDWHDGLLMELLAGDLAS